MHRFENSYCKNQKRSKFETELTFNLSVLISYFLALKQRNMRKTEMVDFQVYYCF